MSRIKVFFYSCLLLCCSCSSYRFAKDGIFVNDVDEYFNPKEEINVWLYSNFYPYRGLDKGLRIGSLYDSDKAVLKKIGWSGKHAKLLFSAIPESGPIYHIIAIQHLRQNLNLEDMDRLAVDSSFFYQRDYKMEQLDIRHVYIPYGRDRALSLVYYSSAAQYDACPFCKLDYLARINANALQHQKSSALSWQINECADAEVEGTRIAVNVDFIKKYKYLFLKVYADYGTSTGIQYFQILNSKSIPALKLKLCPDRYIVEWTDSKHYILQVDTLVVK
ncbi:hypothetical protein [Sphingobacterium rhinopitheci]|uniref:hypothetical protein n=1 Tax=Sphingobacterium rhinopitheci TaxID=2781960 RepID=UPI001F528A57|nr:hypothetical protein [Sphingobacterium rhinopitheci]MCI0921689.1 hypothetical protein [Sphingobacterium rhinopitheci]